MPFAYTPEQDAKMQDRLIEEIEKGRSLRKILAEDVDMEFPTSNYIYQWLNPDHKKYDAGFALRYARACEARADKLFEEMLEIADTPVEGTTTKIDEDGITITKADMVQHRRLQVDTRKWMIGKMRPKKYGDRHTTVHEGGEKPVEVVDYSKLSPEFLEELAKQSDAGTPKSE